MTFIELNKDFQKRRPKGSPIEEIPWFSVKWENGNDSANDLLRCYLRENGFEYINTFGGEVWFLYHNIWTCCTCEVKMIDGVSWVHFSMCKFDDTACATQPVHK